jgi:predicted ATPase
VLGWIAAATIGGALDWRPSLWITGDLSTGKSTLLERLGASPYLNLAAG